MADTAEINDVRELDGFCALWRSLLRKTPRPCFVQSLEFLKAAWPRVAPERKLRVVLVLEDGEAVSLMPLAVGAGPAGWSGLRRLSHPIDGFEAFSGAVGPESTTVMKAFFIHVTRRRRDWDVLDLVAREQWGAADSALCAGAAAAGLRIQPIPIQQSAAVDMAGGFQSYWQRRPVTYRRMLADTEESCQSRHRAEHVRWRPPAQGNAETNCRWDLFEMCRQIGRCSRYLQTVRRSSAARLSLVPHILRDVHPVACQQGAVDLNLLLVDGEPAAFLYNYLFEGHLQTVWSGWDPRAGGKRAASLLIARTVRDSFQRHDKSIDLGLGSLATAQGVQTQVSVSSRLLHFSKRSFRGQFERLRWCTPSMYPLPTD